LKTNSYGLPSIVDFLKIIGTFILVTVGLVIFKADNTSQAWQYFDGICNLSLPSMQNLRDIGVASAIIPLVFALFLFVIEWIYKDSEYPLAQLGLKWKRPLRYSLYYLMILAIYLYGGEVQQFIYFQF
jgi:hypothetical protein